MACSSLVRLFRRVLPDDSFWALISVMEGRTDADAVEKLTGRLRTLGRGSVYAFHERLAATLHDLDRKVLADRPVRLASDAPGLPPHPMDDDTFLFVRAGLVAHGRDAVEAVLTTPDLLSVGVRDECEGLLYAAEEATGRAIRTAVSYETGSNRAHWPPRPVHEDEVTYSPPAVFVDCRDLSDPRPVEVRHPDGRVERAFEYGWPEYLVPVLSQLSRTFAILVTLTGGLPVSVGVVQVRVVVDVGTDLCLTPQVGEPFEDPDMTPGPVREVRVALPARVLRSWTADQQREALSSVVADCLLAVLPEGHEAAAELVAMRDMGARHLQAA